ncbi:MAG: ATP-binding protein [Nitrospirota bacterium]
MSELELFIDNFMIITPICLLYFVYGLAFLFLGVAIVVKDKKASELRLASCLWLLAGFGFSHGAHEWLELYLLLQEKYISVQEIFFVNLVIVFVVVLSFLFLLQFGLALIRSIDNNRMKWLKVIPAILFLFWVIYLWNNGFSIDIQFFEKADSMARNTFGLLGGVVTAYGLVTYSREVKNLDLSVSKNLFYAGITFVFYGFFAGIVPSRSMLPFLPFPVEVLRGISAVLLTCFIIKALNIFDIEKKRRLEQQLKRLAKSEKLASLGQLAAGIAHEINNPLTNVSLNIQTLRERLKDAITDKDILQKLEAIEKNVDKASIIVKELLQSSHQRESEFIPLNINNIINSTLTLLRYKLNSVTIHQNLTDVPDIIGDTGKLQQVFINILNNALEAMPDGGDIYISTSCDNNDVKIEISDTGSGISDEHLTRVFDPFFTTKGVGAGTGLGLSICYGIINQHDGTIEISSSVGRGTTVIIKLPS